MILVTGAAGKTGQAIITALARKGNRVRALVYRPEQSQIVRTCGAEESFLGDMTLARTFDEALKGIKAIYHICPNVSPHEVEISKAAIEACLDQRVKRFVYHSVLHPQTSDMPHHWAKLQVEELLLRSDLECTILQPAAYMQNVLGNWDVIVGEGVFQVPYPIETRISVVDLLDVADVAAKLIAEPKHIGATYELVGPEALSQIEVAQILTDELGFEVRPQQENIEDWKTRMQRVGLGEYRLMTLAKMFEHYAKYGFRGSPVILKHLLQREPTNFRTFVRRILTPS